MLALVDEWGNPEPGSKGTDWFGFGAVFIPDSRLPETRTWYADACRCLGHPSAVPIHATRLKADTKYHWVRSLADAALHTSAIAVRIHNVNSEFLKKKGWAYRFYGREMVRVATHYAGAIGEEADIVFEHHRYLDGFADYVRFLLRTNTWYAKRNELNRIRYDTLGSLQMEDKSAQPLLSLADCVAHAMYCAFNANKVWGATNPTYINVLGDTLWEGPTGHENARLYGAQLEPHGVAAPSLIATLPDAYRRFWS